ncbi:MAG: ComEC/Rec2 family competence protein [Corynebacterium sp.]|uniref:ComEC/Rec2 family competence protein n=1 Tax=Corynebacterium sp. TaxID=1720 RepID=UPI0026DA9E83|nr:ComEC/Rec2 family competence protein [Corynebacterium sp.]MDO5099471.1 ComEC/Rec2 family competence protein [Corynebacterium sp.]
MTQWRLVPGALVVWALSFAAIWLRGGSGLWIVVVVFGIALIGCLKVDVGQAIMCGLLGLSTLMISMMRVWRVDRYEWGRTIIVQAVSRPRRTNSGWMQEVGVPDYPATIPVLSDTPLTIPPGAMVEITGTAITTDRIGLSNTLFTAQDWQLIAPPPVAHAVSNAINASFTQAVTTYVDGDAAALIPAMVLGDTTAQSAELSAVVKASGLAHLTAVSGANVAIIATCAALVSSRFPLWLRSCVVLMSIIGFVTVVGPEPSVLRAAVTGIIGVVAIIAASTSTPIHGLALTTIGLLYWDTSLAAHVGFILSIVATAGILLLYPVLLRFFVSLPAPAIAVRALAVALAAQLVTMPIVATMSGTISVVAVLANVIAAPVVAPITLLGMAAVVLSLIHPDAAMPLMVLVELLADWVVFSARTTATLPGAQLTIDSPFAFWWAVLAACWVVALLYRRLFKTLVLLVAAILIIPSPPLDITKPQPRDPLTLSTLTVETIDELEKLGRDVNRDGLSDGIAPGTEIILVLRAPPARRVGRVKPIHRPTITREGIPVIFANRHPDVIVYSDGSQHAVDGSF